MNEQAETNNNTPSIVPALDFNVHRDVIEIHNTIGFFRVNVDTLLQILTKRTNDQRQEIVTTYKSTYAKDLPKIIATKSFGNVKELLVALLQKPAHFYVYQLHQTFSHFHINEETLAEILCGLTNDEIKTVNELYNHQYNRRLESLVDTKVSSELKRFFIYQLLANREEDDERHIDVARALEDAREIFKTVHDCITSECSVFVKIFLGRSFSHIRQINTEYIRLTTQPLERAVKKVYSGVAKRVFYAIVRYSVNKTDYYAGKFYQSMNGLGTNNSQLIRLAVGRSDIDLNSIKVMFAEKYGKSLREWIVGDTSGSFRDGLLLLIGEESREK